MIAEVIKDPDDLSPYSDEWDQLFASASPDNPFLSRQYIEAWWNHFGPKSNRGVVFFREGNDLVGVVPFDTVATPGLWATIRFPGDAILSDYTDVLAATAFEEQVWGEFGKCMAALGSWRAIVFSRVCERSRSFAVHRGSMLSKNFRHQPSTRVPFVDLPEDWETYWNSRPAKLRKELRGTERKLMSIGAVTEATCSSYGVRDALDCLKTFHLERQYGKSGQSLFANGDVESFIRRLANLKWPWGGSEVSVLKAGDRTVSVVFGLRTRHIYHYWIPSFDSSIPGVSIGKLHLSRLIERAHLEGCAGFDLMIGAETYKLDWATRCDATWRISRGRTIPDGWVDTASVASLNMMRSLKRRWRFLEVASRRVSKFK